MLNWFNYIFMKKLCPSWSWLSSFCWRCSFSKFLLKIHLCRNPTYSKEILVLLWWTFICIGKILFLRTLILILFIFQNFIRLLILFALLNELLIKFLNDTFTRFYFTVFVYLFTTSIAFVFHIKWWIVTYFAIKILLSHILIINGIFLVQMIRCW